MIALVQERRNIKMYDKDFVGKSVRFTIESKNGTEKKVVVVGSFKEMLELLPLFDMATNPDFLNQHYTDWMNSHGFKVTHEEIIYDEDV